MKNLNMLQAIFWDFDGVLMDSNAIRDIGFQQVLAEYPQHQVNALLEFHRANGGLSRYVKFRYFFETIRHESITEEGIKNYATQFSAVMLKMLLDERLLIQETLTFVKAHHALLPMHIVSGSDQEELRYLCKQLGIHKYFKRIHGSPMSKSDWLKILLEEEGYTPEACVMIGDSINDYEAALHNRIFFKAFNNPLLESRTNEIFNIDLHK